MLISFNWLNLIPFFSIFFFFFFTFSLWEFSVLYGGVNDAILHKKVVWRHDVTHAIITCYLALTAELLFNALKAIVSSSSGTMNVYGLLSGLGPRADLGYFWKTSGILSDTLWQAWGFFFCFCFLVISNWEELLYFQQHICKKAKSKLKRREPNAKWAIKCFFVENSTCKKGQNMK